MAYSDYFPITFFCGYDGIFRLSTFTCSDSKSRMLLAVLPEVDPHYLPGPFLGEAIGCSSSEHGKVFQLKSL